MSTRFARQRGVAVITALLLTTLAITIVASLFWQQQVQVRSIENQRLQLQKQWILRGALDWTRLILRADKSVTVGVDHLGEPWAVPLAETRLDEYVDKTSNETEIPDAVLSGSIVDAQSRLNLTNLCENGTINQAEVTVFARLLSSLQQNPALAQATADLMAAAQKKTIATPGAPPNAAQAQPMNILQVDDLLAVPGMTPQILAAIKDFVIVLPKVTPVNVNTAPVEVLAARIDTLSASDAATLVATRKSAWFRNINEFTQRVPGKSSGMDAGRLSVGSDYFLVNGKVRLNRASMEMQALIDRSGGNPKVLWIREN